MPGAPVMIARAPSAVSQMARFGGRTRHLVTTLDNGQPISLTLGDHSRARQFILRPRKITADTFNVTIGSDTPFPTAVRSYDGRSIGDGLSHARIALAVVNDSIAAIITENNGSVLQIRTDPESGTLQTLAIETPEYTCEPGDAGAANFAMTAPVFSEADWEKSPPAVITPAAVAGDDPASGEFTRTVEITPWGQRYDNSLADAMLLIVLDKEAAGAPTTANIESKTSQYLALHSNVASIYEYQLGIRLLLQEFIFIPNTGSYTAVTAGTPSAAGSLDTFETWIAANRPRATYRWTLAALWDNFSSGGTVGLANVDTAGTVIGLCTNQIGKSWSVAGHELGHVFGARHTVGIDGIMMASLSASGTNTHSFFSTESVSGEMGAFTIYEDSHTDLTGAVPMRHPKEMPFANDDAVTTPVNTAVAISPLGNDNLATPSGSNNTTLTLLETGYVLPIGAGTVAITGSNILFTPTTGFEGTAWLSYTVQGDLGNGGSGWLHKADIAVQVGATETPEFDITIAPGASFRMRFPPGVGAVTGLTQPAQASAFNSLNYLSNVFYTITASPSASGTDSFTYSKSGTPYTINITYATTTSWDIEIEAGGSRILHLPPDLSAVSSLTQPTKGNVDPLIESDSITVSGEGNYVYNQYYLLRADANASGTDSFTYVKAGVTSTVNITYIDIPVEAMDDNVAAFDPALGAYRFNPVNNDAGPGLFAVSSIKTGPPTGAGTLAIANGRYLVSATNLTPAKGALTFETRPMTIGGVSTDVISGYLLFTPAKKAAGIAQVEYTVIDAAGNTDTAIANIAIGIVSILSPVGNNVVAPDHGVVLKGAVTNPDAPFPPVDSTLWTYSSNSGTVTFSDAGELETKATFSNPGAYTLRLTGKSSEYVAGVETSILVSALPVPTDNLLVLIDFDESSGTIASDASGNGNNATLKGSSPTWEPSGGRIDGSVNVNATGEYATLPSLAGYNNVVLDAYAVSIWFKASSLASSQGIMLYEAGGTGSGHSLYILNSQLIAGSWDTITTVDWSFIQGPSVDTGVWHHAVLSCENDTMTLWYDGQAFGSATGFSFLSDTNPNGIGAINLATLIDENFADGSASTLSSATGSRRFEGSLDRLTVHTRALSAADVKILYEANLNQAPVITLPSTPLAHGSSNDIATLSASASDNDPVTTLWQNATTGGSGKVFIESPTAPNTDVLFSALGTYEICFRAADDQIETFKTRSVNVAGSSVNYYAQWISGFPDVGEGDTEYGNDLDGDRLPNLIEYAISSHPTVPSDSQSPYITSVEDGGQNFLKFSYRRLRDIGVDESVGQTGIDRTYRGVTYTIEVTDDLEIGIWRRGAGQFTIIGSPVDNGDGTETITVRLLNPIETAPRQFVKLTVTDF